MRDLSFLGGDGRRARAVGLGLLLCMWSGCLVIRGKDRRVYDHIYAGGGGEEVYDFVQAGFVEVDFR